MKRFIAVIICLPLLYACSSRIWGDDTMSEQSYQINTEIEAIEIKSAMTLNLVDSLEIGDMIISANSNILQYINVTRRENTVAIELEENNYKGIEITIYAPVDQYQYVTASGASTINKMVGSNSSKNYSITLSGASIFSGNVTITRELTCTLSGASTAYLQGETSNCDVTCAGASNIYGKEFACTDLNISLSGASYVQMEVNGDIIGELKGASTLEYSGNAKSEDIDLSGASSIIKE
ncbi:MAG: DUF2807 domain-containing protein [Rikenellaceae bacterium]